MPDISMWSNIVIWMFFFYDWINFTQVNGQELHFQDETLFEGSSCLNSNGDKGTCKHVKDCEVSFRSYGDLTNCYFNGTDPVVCCKQITNELKERVQPLQISSSTNADVSILIDVCLEFYTEDKIFSGGWLAKPGEHPHMAAIGWILDEGVIDWNCGGSLISWNHILTAAHCVSKNFKPDIVRINDISVIDIVPGEESADFSIKNIFIHPDYKDEFVYHDLAIIEVEKKVGGNYKPKPACIWHTNEIPVSEVFAMGYGTSSFGGPKTNVLYQGNLTLVDQEKCQKDYGLKSRYPKGIMDFQICAHDPRQIVDTCQGDSGGPLQFSKNWRNEEVPYLVGVTSFGQNCFGSSPGIYTRIYPYIGWITSIVWKH